MKRYRLAGRGHVTLYVAPRPGGHLSAGKAVELGLNGVKLVKFSEYKV